jgi:ATP-dependent helicase/nuclease subunit A
VQYLIEAVAPFVLQFRETALRRGFVTFDGLLSLTRDLLRDCPDVRRQVKARYDLLFVDEFQDTDPLQYEIVLLLAQSAEDTEDNPYQAELEPGKLFIVGDAKQSIYRFRGADYSAYRRAVTRILEQGGEQLVLGANFRSVAGVVEPINRLFERSNDGCWIESSEQPPYQPIDAVRGLDDTEPSTEVWTVTGDDGARADERRHAEGDAIASEIERLVQQGQVRYGEISVLFRSFTSLGHYIRPLRERDIPFVVDGGREFLERPEVAHLIGTLHALAQPADQTALLAYLRSPAGAVPDTDLAAYRAAGGRWDWRSEPEGKAPRLIEQAFLRLRALADRTRDLPADAVIRAVLEDTQLLPLNAAAFEGPQRVANLRKLAASAGELARDGRLSLEEVVEALQEGRVTEIESDAPLADDSVDAVRISTIHRMKGLENSWVFLPDLARGKPSGRRDRAQARAVLGPAGEMLALRLDEVMNSAALWWDRENERHEAAEEVRVFYVALTRARNRLVLVAGRTRRGAPWMDALGPWGLDFGDPPADGERCCGGRVIHRIVEPSAARRTQPRKRTTPTQEATNNQQVAMDRLDAARSPFVSPSGLQEETDRCAEDAPSFHAPERSREAGRAAGSVVHRWLEFRRVETHAEALVRLGDLCREVAGEAGMDERELEREARSIVESFLDSELCSHLDRIEVLAREVPILLRSDNGQTFRGSIDLLYRDSSGRIVVADYKTDRETDGRRLLETYRKQMAIYADAVQKAYGLDHVPRTEIWALRTGSILA